MLNTAAVQSTEEGQLPVPTSKYFSCITSIASSKASRALGRARLDSFLLRATPGTASSTASLGWSAICCREGGTRADAPVCCHEQTTKTVASTNVNGATKACTFNASRAVIVSNFGWTVFFPSARLDGLHKRVSESWWSRERRIGREGN